MRKYYHARPYRKLIPLTLALGLAGARARAETSMGARWVGLLAKHVPACVETYAGFFAAPVVPPKLRGRIAALLCADSRVYADFAWAHEAFAPSADRAALAEIEDLAELRFATEKHYSPLIIGVSGASPAQTEALLKGLRESRYAGSEHVFRWSDDEAAFNRWVRQLKGGVMPGVIHAHVDRPRERPDQARAAQNLLWSTFSRHSQSNTPFTWDFSEYTVLITSGEDLSAMLHQVGDPIHWLTAQEDDCRSSLL